MKNKEKILILDGYNLFYRARYSGMNKGEFSTIFNFFRGLRPLVEKFKPSQVDLVLEGVPKKRLEILSEYKGQRTYHNKDNFLDQRRSIVNILKNNFPINLIRHPDYECDDVIGYLSKKYEKLGKEVTVVSSDTDFIQLINENIKLYNPVKKDYVQEKSFNYVFWKALVGDSSDNILGFKGIGNKTALKLLENKNLFEEFLEKKDNREKFNKNVSLIKFHNLLEDNEDQNIEFFYHQKESRWEELRETFNNMNFNSIISKEKTWQKYIDTFDNLF